MCTDSTVHPLVKYMTIFQKIFVLHRTKCKPLHFELEHFCDRFRAGRTDRQRDSEGVSADGTVPPSYSMYGVVNSYPQLTTVWLSLKF